MLPQCQLFDKCKDKIALFCIELLFLQWALPKQWYNAKKYIKLALNPIVTFGINNEQVLIPWGLKIEMFQDATKGWSSFLPSFSYVLVYG